jgi:hypothetical protein
MIGMLIAVGFAALTWLVCMTVGLPAAVAVVAAIVVLVLGLPSNGYGLGSRLNRY